MTEAEAIALARRVAEAEGWPWQEPVVARRYRTLLLVGKRCWHVSSNADVRGCNVNVHIEDSSGLVVAKGFAPR